VVRRHQRIRGVALSPDGRPLILAAAGLLWVVVANGEKVGRVERLEGDSSGDGFAFDADGRVCCACTMDHFIRVLDALCLALTTSGGSMFWWPSMRSRWRRGPRYSKT